MLTAARVGVPGTSRLGFGGASIVGFMLEAPAAPPLVHVSDQLTAPVAYAPSTSESAGGAPRLVVPATTCRVGSLALWLDGVAMVGEQVVLDNDGLKSAIPAGVAEWTMQQLAAWWGGECRTPSVLYAARPDTGELAVLPDPLGGGVVYRHDDTSGTTMSSDLTSLARDVRYRGGTVTPDQDHQVQRLLTGLGGQAVSPFAHTLPLPPRTFAVMDSRGVSIREYPVFEGLQSLGYDELLERAVQELRANLAALASTPDTPIVAHLTGGFDSRLVLAASIRAGVTERVQFFCSGPEGTADRVVADGITQLLGLRRVSTDANVIPPFRTQAERQLAAMVASAGLSEAAPTGAEIPQNAVAVGGGWGEMYRPAPTRQALTADARGIDILVGAVPRFNEATAWVKPSALSRVARQFGIVWKSAAAASREEASIPDRLWLDTRARFHFGSNALAISRTTPRFDPLYSVAGAVMVDVVPRSMRLDNIVGFDLIAALAPRLLEIPFETYSRFGEGLAQRRPVPPLRDLPRWRRPELETLDLLRATHAPRVPGADELWRGIDMSPPSAAQRQAAVSRANNLHLPYWQVVTLEQTQAMLKRSLDTLDLSILAADIDVDELHRLATSDVKTRTDIRAVHRFTSYVGWVAQIASAPIGS